MTVCSQRPTFSDFHEFIVLGTKFRLSDGSSVRHEKHSAVRDQSPQETTQRAPCGIPRTHNRTMPNSCPVLQCIDFLSEKLHPQRIKESKIKQPALIDHGTYA